MYMLTKIPIHVDLSLPAFPHLQLKNDKWQGHKNNSYLEIHINIKVVCEMYSHYIVTYYMNNKPTVNFNLPGEKMLGQGRPDSGMRGAGRRWCSGRGDSSGEHTDTGRGIPAIPVFFLTRNDLGMVTGYRGILQEHWSIAQVTPWQHWVKIAVM